MNELPFTGYDYPPDNPHNVDASSVLIDANKGEKATVVYDNVTYVGTVVLNDFGRKSIIVQLNGGEHDGDWVQINW